jgi:hypothetical protein
MILAISVYYRILSASILFILLLACSDSTDNNKTVEQKNIQKPKIELKYDTTIKTAHILVALCDNTYQGIVPVPKAIGNGQDCDNNLYWGCGYGVRTYFKTSKNWSLVRKSKVDSVILERLVFKHKNARFYLVCDAYIGQNIQDCTTDFLQTAAGLIKDTLHLNNATIGINGNAQLVTYIGHNGLMDFSLNQSFKNTDHKKRDVVILACKSKQYFADYIHQAQANPILWTSNLMCPEAYTIHDLLEVYINAPSDIEKMNTAAALAYSKYQKCGLNASKKLLVSGF